jgi:SAM-dependent methyltransferase
MHVDLGSDVRFVGMLTAIVSAVTFLDVRPVKAHLPQLHSVAASALDLPLPSRSVRSLSCLHVAEHVGLGRYGDTLDPEGTKRTCQEISRVLAPGGNLLFSLPVGRPRVCFNAHRIHSPLQVLTCFKGLELIEFSAVDDRGKFREKADLDEMGQASYACGLFWFKLAKTPS